MPEKLQQNHRGAGEKKKHPLSALAELVLSEQHPAVKTCLAIALDVIRENMFDSNRPWE